MQPPSTPMPARRPESWALTTKSLSPCRAPQPARHCEGWSELGYRMSLPRGTGRLVRAPSSALLPPTPSSSKQKPRPLSHMGPRGLHHLLFSLEPGSLNPCGGKQQPPYRPEFLSYSRSQRLLTGPSPKAPAWSEGQGAQRWTS